MLCKSLRSAAKNDALRRFLNALVQIPVIRFRKTKTDKRVCLSVLFGGKPERHFELFVGYNKIILALNLKI